MITFPKDFFWGAASSAYQVEGDNNNCDWWEWEARNASGEHSGKACRHFEYYAQDFDIAKSLNHTCHRISVEWSRIEPRPGEFSDEAMGHYRQVILALRARGLEPVVTLHHFTNPLWFAQGGGWEKRSSAPLFARFAARVVDALGDQVRFWITINEPNIYTYESYLVGTWPPQKKSVPASLAVLDNLALAHVLVYRDIHARYGAKKLAAPMVSVAQNVRAFVSCRSSLKNRLACYIRGKNFNFSFIDTLIRHHALDFIGLNYYSRDLVDLDSWSIPGIFMDTCKKHNTLPKNSLGWEIYPQGLCDLLVSFKRYGLPLFVMENGICTQDDATRWEFIRGHLMALAQAQAQGAHVLGYVYWSLLDNFEWDKGFGPRFGLVEMDYHTYKRTVRPSALRFAEVCKSGTLE